MKHLKPGLLLCTYTLIGLILTVVTAMALFVILTIPQLPSLDALTEYRPKLPLRIFTSDGYLLAEFGDERRSLASIRDFPAHLKQAILAAEDDTFYEHHGVDYLGVLRAAVTNFIHGETRQGASTITMQVARNFFLTKERTFRRKLYEIMLAFKIESSLKKDQIFELYLNQIYLGQRAYGFATAAQTYFNKPLASLSVAESAMLAGLPKAPSLYNPVINFKRAQLRQMYVLRRMHELKFISDAQYAAAKTENLKVVQQSHTRLLGAEFIAESIRQYVQERYPDDAYKRGFRVFTTIINSDQETAALAVRNGLLDYDKRHGYRGPEGWIDLNQKTPEALDESIDEALLEYPNVASLVAGVVLNVQDNALQVALRGGKNVTLSGEQIRFAKTTLGTDTQKGIRRGSIIRLISQNNRWFVTQIPAVEGALVSADPNNGNVLALVGGFDFNRNKFNHVLQAWRQPGSSIKPFIYAAGMEHGFTPESVFEDSPLSFSTEATGGQTWEPKNYDGKYEGPMSLRTALTKSKNMVSIRLLKSIGPTYAQDFLARFGFDKNRHPPYLTMALGAGSVTPWQMLKAYGVFANDGYPVVPHLVDYITDDQGQVIFKYQASSKNEEDRVISPDVAWKTDSMLKDVIRSGTGAKALSLGRRDLAGKTGTTNNYIDAWFCGYQPNLVTITWVGFDQPHTLGPRETGGSTALPIWIQYMKHALRNMPEKIRPVPNGIEDSFDPLSKPVGAPYDSEAPSL